jgi:hypothetical protein
LGLGFYDLIFASVALWRGWDQEIEHDHGLEEQLQTIRKVKSHRYHLAQRKQGCQVCVESRRDVNENKNQKALTSRFVLPRISILCYLDLVHQS